MSTHAFICDAQRTPFGRYGGALSSVRTDDLAALPIKALMARNAKVDWQAVGDVIYGCANQAGEDNRNVARMAALLAGLPVQVSGATINRLCGSGLDALGTVARAIRAGDLQLAIAGGVESMSRAPFVMPKADTAFSRSNAVYDTTIGWRFVNKLMKEQYGVDSMPETAENVATDLEDRARRIRTAWRWPASSRRWRRKRAAFFDARDLPGDAASRPQGQRDPWSCARTSIRAKPAIESLAKLKARRGPQGRHGHRRQCQRRQRRRLRAAGGVRRSRRRATASRRIARDGGHGHSRRTAAHHGHRPRRRPRASCWS